MFNQEWTGKAIESLMKMFRHYKVGKFKSLQVTTMFVLKFEDA
jgi:hypothetical protein